MTEKKKSIKKTKKVPAIIGVVVVAAAIGASFYVFQVESPFGEEPEPEYDFRKTYWQVSGPFAIDKPKYLLSENIFLSVNGLLSHEAGNIIFKRPDGSDFKTIPFDGLVKSEFNNYFTPGLLKPLGVCGPEDLAGTWQVIFEGVNYAPLTFEILYDYVPGEKYKYEPVC